MLDDEGLATGMLLGFGDLGRVDAVDEIAKAAEDGHGGGGDVWRC